MVGYVRQDSSNNIDNDNVINASDLDNEFDGVVAAFDASTGHKHDGSSAEGAPIVVTGPAQEYLFDGVAIYPKADDTYDLGKSGAEFKDLYIDGVAYLDSVTISAGTITGITDLAVADGGTGASTEAGARTNLGLGTIATQDADSVSISGGSVTGITDLAVADGGTGASTASDARDNLGLTIGTDVQAWDADLDTYAANPLTAAELGELQNIDSVTITNTQWGYLGAATAFGGSLMDDADAAAGRTTLGLGTIATQDADSVSISGGSVTGITDLAVADGGTGASTEAGARSNLGVADPDDYGALVATYGGTANAITLTTGLSLSSLTEGQVFRFKAGASNTGGTSINVDGIGAETAVTVTGAGLPADYIVSGEWHWCYWNGTNIVVSFEPRRISNANGAAWRYPNRLQICYSSNAGAPAANASSGGVFRSGSATTWTFPAAFQNDAVSVSFNADSAVRWVTGAASSGSAANFYHFSATSSSTTVLTRAKAIGNWY